MILARARLLSSIALLTFTLAGPMALAQGGLPSESFGEGIPLRGAASQIVPEGYSVRLGPGVNESAPVSWRGGTWQEQINAAARSAGYRATVSGRSVTIVRAGAEVERVATTPTDAQPQRSARAERQQVRRSERRTRTAQRAPRREAAPQVVDGGVSGGGFVLMPVRGSGQGWRDYRVSRAAGAAGERGSPSDPQVREWTVTPGQNLHSLLSDWAGREGWRLVWRSDYQYQLTSAARFRGDFMTATTELIRSMSSVRPMVTARFFEGNKTLVVGNDSLDEAN